jgi:hypothetical protein
MPLRAHQLHQPRDRWAREQFSQHAADFPVWETITYVAEPPLTRTQGASFRAQHRWAHAQYPALASAVDEPGDEAAGAPAERSRRACILDPILLMRPDSA